MSQERKEAVNQKIIQDKKEKLPCIVFKQMCPMMEDSE
jgi:hypothetical protein